MTLPFPSSAAAVAFLAVTASPALAQSNGTPPALATAPTQEAADQWRASKLSGVAVYGPDNKLVGKITDVLMSHDGRAEKVVIGVGGFLGLGQKDVALPFDQVKFTDEPINPPNNAAAINDPASGTTATSAARSTMNGVAPNGGIDPAAPVGLGTPTGITAGGGVGQAPRADTTGVTALGAGASGADGVNPAAAMPRSTAYPDHGTIDMTADQLKSAPSFKFAR